MKLALVVGDELIDIVRFSTLTPSKSAAGTEEKLRFSGLMGLIDTFD